MPSAASELLRIEVAVLVVIYVLSVSPGQVAGGMLTSTVKHYLPDLSSEANLNYLQVRTKK